MFHRENRTTPYAISSAAGRVRVTAYYGRPVCLSRMQDKLRGGELDAALERFSPAHKQSLHSSAARLGPSLAYCALLHWRRRLQAWVLGVEHSLFGSCDSLCCRQPSQVDTLGLLIVAAGQGDRVLAIGGVQDIRRCGRRKRVSAGLLIRMGFFAHARGPLDLGNLLIFCGLGIIANSHQRHILQENT